MAAHRFLGSPEVTPDALLTGLTDRTRQACRGRYVVAAQDTTEINFSGADRGRRGLGLAGDGKSLGFFAHAVVAIDADDEAVLGIAGARIWTRGTDKVTEVKSGTWRTRNWSAGWKAARPLPACWERRRALSSSVTVKATSTRYSPQTVRHRSHRAGARQPQTGRWWSAVRDRSTVCADRWKERQGRATPTAPARGQRPYCRCRVVLRTSDDRQAEDGPYHARCRAGDTQSGRGARGRRSQLGTAAAVAAVDDPAGRDGRGRRGGYPALSSGRRIEQVFRVLKRDGLALEETQIEGAARLFNLTALALGAAARIIQLTDARDASNRPATDVIDPSLIDAVHAISKTLEGKTDRQKNHHPPGSLTWLAWITARLGGWNCYYKPPGPKTMADGWRRLAYMLGGYAIAQAKSNV